MSRRTKVQPAHPELVPRWCRWFGHARHNDLVAARGGRGVYIAANPCVRAGCPGDGHVWQRVERTEPGAPGIDERCAVDGCTATRHLRPPTPAAPVAPVASVIIRSCVDTESYARAFNDGFDTALEQVIEELTEGQYCDPDDDALHAAILRDYGMHLRQMVDDANESARRKPGRSEAETVWGVRWRNGSFDTYPDQETAQRALDDLFGYGELVYREVGPWRAARAAGTTEAGDE